MKLVDAETTMTGDGDSNTMFGCLKYVSFLLTINQIILSNL